MPNKQKISVLIELYTTIDDDGQKESYKSKQTGVLYKKGNIDVLTFEEVAEDASVVKNLVTIQPDKVSLKRSGNLSMNQQFHVNKATENVLKHPYGNLHMETFTTAIVYEPLTPARNGSLQIVYDVKLNGQQVRQQKIDLIMKEVDMA
ncbi:hypothetical protein J32TS6_22580 [Virgibacillus pantothenticus]|uniref:DUF1934 domain-containing protein n=1 Tax=Virgibacillus pantothenticus TaxID=1473 RepID=A0A0L0QSF3_VIRPA|nr:MULTISPECIES: DUF1934 domain-containing protein [Virgibacillus]API91857.1 hypothetical protein BKP57_08445 [Virgibacillus sp. 6R]KNE21504.1 hypothetical protein AFK71_07570 [Virgibacillus pantothenticus]MBS7430301.1 DUF1934 domain-containing protein [Virgibacillus sp. 19R1-5]MBU8566518.1 DUF1934 domain-containing protein [Virgibacillus pantothenticus]MBU8599010.1 DUF1934 domain-containing protein [Virgibacillus pantothenticus]